MQKEIVVNNDLIVVIPVSTAIIIIRMSMIADVRLTHEGSLMKFQSKSQLILVCYFLFVFPPHHCFPKFSWLNLCICLPDNLRINLLHSIYIFLIPVGILIWMKLHYKLILVKLKITHSFGRIVWKHVLCTLMNLPVSRILKGAETEQGGWQKSSGCSI